MMSSLLVQCLDVYTSPINTTRRLTPPAPEIPSLNICCHHGNSRDSASCIGFPQIRYKSMDAGCHSGDLPFTTPPGQDKLEDINQTQRSLSLSGVGLPVRMLKGDTGYQSPSADLPNGCP